MPLFAWLLQYITAALLLYRRSFLNVCPVVQSGHARAIPSTLKTQSVFAVQCQRRSVIS